MQIEVKMKSLDTGIITHDYLYPMAAMLKTVLTQTQPNLTEEIYEGRHKDRIKLFTFSPLNSYPGPKSVQVAGAKRRQMLLGEKIWFRLASPWPELLNALGQALLTFPEVRILAKQFRVTAINMIAPPELTESMVWRPFAQSASICTPWSRRADQKKLFLYPDSTANDAPSCAELIVKNLRHKLQRLNEIREDIAQAWQNHTDIKVTAAEQMPIAIEFLPLDEERSYRTLMHYGKNTVIRTWRCPVRVTAPIPVQRMIWATGLGAMNSQGYGLVQEGKQC